jgi:hypothetical protein
VLREDFGGGEADEESGARANVCCLGQGREERKSSSQSIHSQHIHYDRCLPLFCMDIFFEGLGMASPDSGEVVSIMEYRPSARSLEEKTAYAFKD